ncbi:MAG: hypothetical protein IJ957_00700, partial [Rikenellaceae bacterium]|nr:hypothetical protein [Rikenellaceae bacterium]
NTHSPQTKTVPTPKFIYQLLTILKKPEVGFAVFGRWRAFAGGGSLKGRPANEDEIQRISILF